MKNISQTLLRGVGAAALVAAILASSPALARCTKIHPIFGVKTYFPDKYCQKDKAQKTAKSHPAKAGKTAAHIRKKSRPAAQKAKEARRKLTTAPVKDASVAQMQGLLAMVGYEPGPVDGVNGPATKKASQEFNTSVGLSQNASTSETLTILRRINGKL